MNNSTASRNSGGLSGESSLLNVVRKNTAFVMMERAFVPIINFLVTVFIIRKLSVDDFGIYNVLLFAVMGYVSLLSSFGISGVFRRFIPEFFQCGQIAKLRRLVGFGLFIRGLISACLVVLILVFSEKLGELFKFEGALEYFSLVSIGIFFYLQAGLLSTTLTAVFQHKRYTIAKIVYMLIRAALLVGFLLMGLGLTGVLIAESISYILLYTLQLFIYRKFISQQTMDGEATLPSQRLIKFGKYSYFNEMGAQILSVTTDYFIISAFLGPVAVGIYGFAHRVMRQVSHVLPQNVFMDIIRPAFFSKYVQSNDPAQLNRMFNFLVKIISFISLPITLGIILLGDKLIFYVFDPKYMESLGVLWIVSGFTLLNFFTNPSGLVLEAKEKVQYTFYSKIFAVYNLVLDLLVVREYGVIGIALVTSSAVLFKNIFLYYFARKFGSLSLDIRNILRIPVNCIMMCFPVYFMRGYINGLLPLMLVIMLGSGIYFGISLINNTFNSSEMQLIRRLLPKNKLPILKNDEEN